jgi:hypothetical protein
MKAVSELVVPDLLQNPVWKYENDDRSSEMLIGPVSQLPVDSLVGCVVGAAVSLSSGRILMGLLGNVDVSNRRASDHFVTLSLFREDGAVFHLARYHDFDAAQQGPQQLAEFLNLSVCEIFPIAWDISQFVTPSVSVSDGLIPENPPERLSQDQLIKLALS